MKRWRPGDERIEHEITPTLAQCRARIAELESLLSIAVEMFVISSTVSVILAAAVWWLLKRSWA